MAKALDRSQRTVRGILVAAAALLLLLAVATYARADPARVTVWPFCETITMDGIGLAPQVTAFTISNISRTFRVNANAAELGFFA